MVCFIKFVFKFKHKNPTWYSIIVNIFDVAMLSCYQKLLSSIASAISFVWWILRHLVAVLFIDGSKKILTVNFPAILLYNGSCASKIFLWMDPFIMEVFSLCFRSMGMLLCWRVIGHFLLLLILPFIFLHKFHCSLRSVMAIFLPITGSELGDNALPPSWVHLVLIHGLNSLHPNLLKQERLRYIFFLAWVPCRRE